ncbi:hypothetical protein MJ561_24610 [Klebsiella pneumoniae]|nr:hypothetical protein MJ561_24610 [Klebsiella pneumoniae]
MQFRRTALAAAGQAGARALSRAGYCEFTNDWLDAAQLPYWQEHGQIDFALNPPGARAAPAPSPIRVGYRWCCVSFPEQCPRLMFGARLR